VNPKRAPGTKSKVESSNWPNLALVRDRGLITYTLSLAWVQREQKAATKGARCGALFTHMSRFLSAEGQSTEEKDVPQLKTPIVHVKCLHLTAKHRMHHRPLPIVRYYRGQEPRNFVQVRHPQCLSPFLQAREVLPSAFRLRSRTSALLTATQCNTCSDARQLVDGID
jgi:hypothetical protein